MRVSVTFLEVWNTALCACPARSKCGWLAQGEYQCATPLSSDWKMLVQARFVLSASPIELVLRLCFPSGEARWLLLVLDQRC